MKFIRAHQVCTLLAALLITIACGSAHASSVDTIIQSDAQLQQIKFDAVSVESDLQRLENDVRFPAPGRVRVDASVNAPDLQLQRFEVSIDDGPVTTQIYDHIEAIAFRSGGLQRVATVNAAPGHHHLHVIFSAMLNSGSPLEPTISGSFDQSFDKPAGQPLTLELALVRDDVRSAPALRRHSWNDSPGANRNTRARESIYLAAAQHFFLAAAVNQEATDAAAAQASMTPLAAALLEFGSRQQAEMLMEKLAQAGDRSPAFLQIQLQLAYYDYRSNDLDGAAARLAQLKGRIPETLHRRWNDLETRVLLARGQYSEAIPLLRAAAADPATQSSAMARYNLAMALLNEGHTSEGRSVLDDLGQADADDEDLRSLRDKANVVLGYDYLRRKLGKEAIPAFERVRLDGPYTSRALLGLGWARYAEHGHMPRPHWGSAARSVKPDDIATTAAIELPDFSGERIADIQQALIPWMQLRDRDPLDPAVQEALLAIPYSFQKAGAAEQAGRYYAEAIAALQKTSDSLDRAAGDDPFGTLFDELIKTDTIDDSAWSWQLDAIPATRSSWLLRPLIAEGGFQIALRDYRDSHFLLSTALGWRKRLDSLTAAAGSRALDGLKQRIDGLAPRVEAAEGRSRERLTGMAIAELRAQKKSTQVYQLQARMALSRVYDSPPAEDAR